MSKGIVSRHCRRYRVQCDDLRSLIAPPTEDEPLCAKCGLLLDEGYCHECDEWRANQ
jgi:hypothetical protein